jgi:hypothetical protein
MVKGFILVLMLLDTIAALYCFSEAYKAYRGE